MRVLSLAKGAPTPPEFTWQEPENAPLKRTQLYDWHRAHTKHIVPFAGWEMPVWYTGVLDEHNAIRKAAGLFDVSHMGVFEASGPHAEAFLDLGGTTTSAGMRRARASTRTCSIPTAR